MSGGGKGIEFVYPQSHIKEKSEKYDKFVISKYIYNIHLLFCKKYDLRIYVLVTGVAPLKIYVYQLGTVRLASSSYDLNLNNLEQSYKHFTNIDLNKHNNVYLFSKDYMSYNYNKWSFQAYQKYLEDNYKNKTNLYNKIEQSYYDIIIKTIIMMQEDSYNKTLNDGYHFSNFYHIFGFDTLVDDNFNTFLLEINSSPYLTVYDDIDKNSKISLIYDTYNIVGFVPFSKDDKHEPYDKNDNYENIDEVHKNVYESLIEFKRPNGYYERVFPLIDNIDKYKTFFGENINKENKLLWKLFSDKDNLK